MTTTFQKIFQLTSKRNAFVISVIGAGGKTTWIEKTAEAVSKEGKKAAVVTTTHMWMPAKHCAADRPWEEAVKLLEKENIVYYGRVAEAEGKMTFPGREGYQEICRRADVVLVEADGAKEKPIKLPDWSREPVIPENTDALVLVYGLSALGRPLGEVCHRFRLCREFIRRETELAGKTAADNPDKGVMGSLGESVVDREMMLQFLTWGYLEKLRRDFPDMPLTVLLNQADDEKRRADGQWIRARLEERGVGCRVEQLKSP